MKLQGVWVCMAAPGAALLGLQASVLLQAGQQYLKDTLLPHQLLTDVSLARVT